MLPNQFDLNPMCPRCGYFVNKKYLYKVVEMYSESLIC